MELMQNDLFNMLLWPMLMSSPIYIVELIGAMLAIIYWSRHPMVSLMALLSFALMFVTSVASRLATTWILMYGRDSYAWDQNTTGFMMAVAGFFNTMCFATALAFLVVAVFGWRRATLDYTRSAKDAPPVEATVI